MQHSPYLRTILMRPAVVLESSMETLKNLDFDAIACTGVSGMLLGPMLANAMGKRLAIIRKPQDLQDSHADVKVETNMESDDSWLFVDDLMATGQTSSRVDAAMRCAGYQERVGSYMYNADVFLRGEQRGDW